MKPEAFELLSTSGWSGFAESYGLEYVEGYISGGSYYALIEIKTTDSSKQREIAGKLSGSFSGFGADAKVTSDAEQKIKKALSDEDIAIYICQAGGDGDVLETTLPDMIEQAKKFPSLVKDNPVCISAITNTYVGSVTLPKSIPSIFSLNEQEQKLDELGRRYLKLRDYKSSLEFALDNFEELSEIDYSDRKTKKDELENALDSAVMEIDEIFTFARKCLEYSTNFAGIIVPQNVKFITLPRGNLVNLKQMEEKLAELTNKVQDLQQRSITDGQKVVIKSPFNTYFQGGKDGVPRWSGNLGDWEKLTINKA